MKVYIEPRYRREDRADGGIRRVTEAQEQFLPAFGVDLCDSPDEADLIACHGASLVTRPGKPMVAHCHGLYWKRYAWDAWAHSTNRQVASVLSRSQAQTAPSEWVANAIRRGMYSDPVVIHHGIDPKFWSPGTPGGYILWNKARVDSVSDPAPMDILATFLPEIPFLSTFGRKARNVQVTGPIGIDQMRPLVRNASLYLATTRETFGIGTLEALSCGVPVVGWDYGGQREIIRQGVTGFLAPEGNFALLAEFCKQILEDREPFSQAAREDALERWTWPARIEQYADLYKRVVDAFYRPGPKVSVILTCKDLARFLDDCLGSVQRQGMKEWECLIVDDCSQDETPQIGKEWEKGDPRFRYIRPDHNLGLSGARNFGIARAKGKYVIPLDADDMLADNALEILSSQLDTDSAIHIAYGHLDTISEDGSNRQRGDWPYPRYDWLMQISHLNQLPYSAMIRREVFDLAGGYRERCWRAEDAEQWARLTSRGFRAKKVTEASTLIYRWRKGSKTQGEPGDGDWLAWFPWTLAHSVEEARAKWHMIRNGGHPKPDLVPWGAQGDPPEKVGFWGVRDLSDPKVSVIIPVGPGHEHILVDALDSVLFQTFQDFECIVVNDTGKEWGKGISSPLQGNWWARVISTPGKKGTGFARNEGAKIARGKALFWLDADDILLPNALEEFYDLWDRLDGKQVVYCDWLRADRDPKSPMLYYLSEDFVCGQILSHMGHSIVTMVPRWAHEAVSGFDEGMVAWEDWDYLIALQALGLCSYRIPEPLFVYRFNLGKRREAAILHKDRLLHDVFIRWYDYYRGGKEMGGCGKCPGPDRTRHEPPQPEMIDGIITAPEPMILLEWTARPDTNLTTFRGHASGSRYRFAPGEPRYVWKSDAPAFLAMTDREGMPIFEDRTPPPPKEIPPSPYPVEGEKQKMESIQMEISPSDDPQIANLPDVGKIEEGEAIAALNGMSRDQVLYWWAKERLGMKRRPLLQAMNRRLSEFPS